MDGAGVWAGRVRICRHPQMWPDLVRRCRPKMKMLKGLCRPCSVEVWADVAGTYQSRKPLGRDQGVLDAGLIRLIQYFINSSTIRKMDIAYFDRFLRSLRSLEMTV